MYTAQPRTNYPDMFTAYEVELPNMDSTMAVELICDIQPGALRQRYSVNWMYTPPNSSYIFTVGNEFNLTQNITYLSNDSNYQCRVTIDHDGKGNISSYEGRYITIVTTISEGITLSEVFIQNLITFFIILQTLQVVELGCQ